MNEIGRKKGTEFKGNDVEEPDVVKWNEIQQFKEQSFHF